MPEQDGPSIHSLEESHALFLKHLEHCASKAAPAAETICPNYQCSDCNRKFSSEQALLKHVKCCLGPRTPCTLKELQVKRAFNATPKTPPDAQREAASPQAEDSAKKLIKCIHCGRSFNPKACAIHQNICLQVFQTPPKPINRRY